MKMKAKHIFGKCIPYIILVILVVLFITTNASEKEYEATIQSLESEIQQTEQEYNNLEIAANISEQGYKSEIQQLKQTNQVFEEKSKKAIVDAVAYDWSEDYYNPSELWFAYNIYNYGDSEATNIKVICKLTDEYGNVKRTGNGNFGNLASKSWGQSYVTTNTILNPGDTLYSVNCYVESCDDCRILYKEIPELVSALEDGVY